MTITEQEYLGGGNYLEHYGRLGMKWYQHKYGEVDGRAMYTEKARAEERKKMARSYANYGRSLTKAGDRAQKKGNQEKLAVATDKLKKLTTQMRLEKTIIDNSSFEMLMADKKAVGNMYAKQFVSYAVGGVIGNAIYNSTNLSRGKAIVADELKTQRRTGQTKYDTARGVNKAGWTQRTDKELEWLNGPSSKKK